jgi:hypothetical protein
MRSTPPTFDWSITEEGEGSETGNEHTNHTASSRLGSPENPILIDIDCEEGDIEPQLGSAQHPILIRDRDAPPQSDDTEPKSDSGPSAGAGPANDVICNKVYAAVTEPTAPTIFSIAALDTPLKGVPRTSNAKGCPPQLSDIKLLPTFSITASTNTGKVSSIIQTGNTVFLHLTKSRRL